MSHLFMLVMLTVNAHTGSVTGYEVMGEPYATIYGCMRQAIARGPQKAGAGVVHVFSCRFDESAVTAFSSGPVGARAQ
jgi:hypothetical protein